MIIVLQLIIAFFIGILSLVMIFRFMNLVLKRFYQFEDKNLAFSIFQSGIIMSCAMILSSIIDPATNAIRMLNPSSDFQLEPMIHSLGFVFVFIIIGIIITILTVFFALLSIFFLTHIDEIQELKNNNIAVAILTISFILGLSLIINDYVGSLCEMIIPYPSVLNIN
jgi:uncharacterized membrane protein YjfL (UPF0719 family)